MRVKPQTEPYAAINPCRLCAPLGACIAFKGFEKTMPVIHGSQGCATYIRRYTISHFREPVDIASSSFDEQAAVFGGGKNLRSAIENVMRQYNPSLIGVVTNCLSETIGDDVPLLIGNMTFSSSTPPIAIASAPSYRGGWEDGYFEAVAAAIKAVAKPGSSECSGRIAVLPPLLSPADIREIASLCRLMGIDPLIAPDISEALDGGTWSEYLRLPSGGTPLKDVAGIGSVRAIVDLGAGGATSPAGVFLEKTFSRKVVRMGLPLGIEATDTFCGAVSGITGMTMPASLAAQRSRAIDAYFDGHKYTAGKRAIIVGDADLCTAIALWCREVGMTPVLIAVNGDTAAVEDIFKPSGIADDAVIIRDTDFDATLSEAKKISPDICFGSGKACGMAGELDVPLIRVAFPIHDRFGAARIQTLGYRGAMELLDRVVNVFLEKKQAGIFGGYSYL